jgi:hypothetical protein
VERKLCGEVLGTTMCSSRQAELQFPTNLWAAPQSQRIYEFDAEQAAHLRMTIPKARMFLLGTAGAIEAHCPAKQTLSPSLYYCRL